MAKKKSASSKSRSTNRKPASTVKNISAGETKKETGSDKANVSDMPKADAGPVKNKVSNAAKTERQESSVKQPKTEKIAKKLVKKSVKESTGKDDSPTKTTLETVKETKKTGKLVEQKKPALIQIETKKASKSE
ncbi:hypothetical protein BMS3Bbin11_01408 [bacterium BMS3Bbin11]|nr:hypothetical protein BMS3Bbin11_01408 [bacterium BMS3Bbin11]